MRIEVKKLITFASQKIATLRNDWYPGRIIDTFNINYRDTGKIDDISEHAHSHSRNMDSERVSFKLISL